MKLHILSVALVVIALSLGTTAAAIPSGLDPSNPGVSAKDILTSGYSSGNGFYWIDPDGPGGNASFQAYADMTTNGGGWTLGIHSVQGSEPSTNDMVSNTGTASLAVGHTRDLQPLAVDSTAEIWHLIKDTSGETVFSGYYTGMYHDALPLQSSWTIQTDTLGLLNYHYGRSWTTATNDQDALPGLNCAQIFGSPWYYGSCFTVIPSMPNDGLTQGPVNVALEPLGQYSIFARELNTPQYNTPEPSSLLLLGVGLVGLVGWRRKHAA